MFETTDWMVRSSWAPSSTDANDLWIESVWQTQRISVIKEVDEKVAFSKEEYDEIEFSQNDDDMYPNTAWHQNTQML